MDSSTRFSKFSESLTSFFTKPRTVGSPQPPKLSSPRKVGFGQFSFEFALPKGHPYEIQVSSDLRTWASLSNGTTTGDSTDFVDSDAERYGSRFYRVASGEALVSVNTLGYVRITLQPGFSLVANPLNAPSNRIGSLFPEMPEGTTLNKFDTTLFKLTNNSFAGGKWSNADELLNPGEGAIVQNPTSEFRPHTFIGDVLKGDLSLPIPAGFSIRSSVLPLAGVLDADLDFPIAQGDVVHLFDRATQQYVIYTYNAEKWTPAPPSVAAGEAFWIGKTSSDNWVQSSLLNRSASPASDSPLI